MDEPAPDTSEEPGASPAEDVQVISPHVPVDLPPPLPVRLDGKSCGNCGYALDGLTSDDLCPECGMPGRFAILGSVLLASDPGYLHGLCRGSLFVLVSLWGRLAVIVIAISIWAVSVALRNSASSGASAQIAAALDAFAVLIDVGVGALALWGWWLLTAVNPAHSSASPDMRNTSLRLTVRALSVLMLGLAMLDSLATMSTLFTNLTPAIGTVTGILMFVGYAATGAFQMAWIRSLARGIPDQKLVGFAGNMIWMHPLLATVGCLFLGLGPLAAWILGIVIATQLLGRMKQLKAMQQRLAKDTD